MDLGRGVTKRKGWFFPKGLLLPLALWKIINFCLLCFFFPSLGQTQSTFFFLPSLSVRGFCAKPFPLVTRNKAVYGERVHDINMYIQISPKIDDEACWTLCHSINSQFMSLMLPFIDQFQERRTNWWVAPNFRPGLNNYLPNFILKCWRCTFPISLSKH